jgi:serine/threonine protein kinase
VIHDFGEVDGRPFIVSEFVEGETLRDRLARGPLAVAEAIHIATQVTAALAAAHARGIVHRAIKPENLMIRPDGYGLLDFGLVKLMPSDDGVTDITRTEPGCVLGTPRYMSPEQARGLDTDARTDVWSVGVLMYEMLAGRPPFDGPSAADVLAAILRVEVPPVDVCAPHVPEAISRILSTAFAKEPASRYNSAADLHAVLADVRSGTDSGIRVAPTATGVATHTMVGRDLQRNELLAAWRRVASGRGELLSISGEPGAGKTTPVENFLGAIRAGEARCGSGRGRCSERLAGTEAYLPVLEALDSLVRSDIGSSVAQR